MSIMPSTTVPMFWSRPPARVLLTSDGRNVFCNLSSPKFSVPWSSKNKVRAQKRKDMLKGQEKCNLLWIYIKLNHWNLDWNFKMLKSTKYYTFYALLPWLSLSWALLDHGALNLGEDRLLKTLRPSLVRRTLDETRLGRAHHDLTY